MPPGAEGAESYKDYILGTRDGMPKTPDWAEPICGVPRRHDRPHRPRIRHDQAGRALPGLRHAAPRLRRAGRPGRLRPGRHHRQRRHPRRLGGRHRPPGARRRPGLDRLPDRRESGQGARSRPSSGPRPSSAARTWTAADGVVGRGKARDEHQDDLRRRLQRPHQPARQHQPHGRDPRATKRSSSSSSSRTTS